MAYTVTLCDLPDLGEQARHRAQKRFRDTLEKHYFHPEKVVEQFRLWNSVAEGHGRDVSLEDGLAAAKFNHFLKKARDAGLQGLADCELAYFDIKLKP
ncbi:MAG: hypothetical protein PGN26_14665 [Xylophilus ampelinus]